MATTQSTSSNGPDAAASALKWRFNRLRCMTPAEISHRVARMLTMYAERAGLFGLEAVPEPVLEVTVAPWVHSGARVDAAEYLTAADRIAAGRLDVFELDGIPFEPP